MADTAVFVYLGMAFMNLDWTGIEWRFVGWVMVPSDTSPLWAGIWTWSDVFGSC